MADGRHFENRYIAISQWKIIRFRWNFVHSSRFWTVWTLRDQKWKSCIGQTPSSTERIYCWKCADCLPKIFKINPWLSKLQLAKVGTFFWDVTIKFRTKQGQVCDRFAKTANIPVPPIYSEGLCTTCYYTYR